MDNYDRLMELCAQRDIEAKAGEPLKNHCSFQIGGPARVMVWPRGESEICLITDFARRQELRGFVLGRGTNVLFADGGFDGVVLCIGRNYAQIRDLGEGMLYCESGASLSALCRYARDNALSGLEFAYGIPGSVGGAVYMNAGAYGGEMKDVLERTRHVTPAGEIGGFAGQAMALGYRHSAYSGKDMVITGAIVRLRAGDRGEIGARMEDYMARRRDKQPLELPSAGSTFKRPEGSYASALVDRCGLKGQREGDAAVSDKHAGFVVNLGGATCKDVLTLIERIQSTVLEQTGYSLQCEVKIVEQ